MTIINFYCIEDDINQFLHSFLTNVVVENNKKVIIYSENQEKINKLDESLWTMKKTSFLPHLKINEEGFEETPLLISNEIKNPINAEFLLISSFLDDEKFLKEFEKIFYIFSPTNQNLVDEAKKNWIEYSSKNFETLFLRKNISGKWESSKYFLDIKNLSLF